MDHQRKISSKSLEYYTSGKSREYSKNLSLIVLMRNQPEYGTHESRGNQSVPQRNVTAFP